jgi:3-dehydroquinate dehydratase type I
VSILPKTVAEALKMIDQAEEAGADLIEVRLDSLKSTEGLAGLASHGEKPKIATNKPVNCRGYFAGTEAEQQRILLDAAKGGFDYVDIELSAHNLKEFTTEASGHGAKVIVSFHDFEGALKLTELDSVLEQEIACGADVCKIVTTAKRAEDNLALLNFTVAACKRTNVVCFAMGDAGKTSRLLSPLFGGFFTFAALERGRETAAGQMTVTEMRTVYKLLGL